MNITMNENIFTLLCIILVALVAFLFGAPTLYLQDTLMVAAAKLAFFLGVCFSLLYSLRGTRTDVVGKIFDGNMAVATFAGYLLIAAALVVGK
jgi:hypothetical protein